MTPGEVFQIVVGGVGKYIGTGAGLDGGGLGDWGGGGGSDVRVCANAAFKLCSLSDRFVVAGGGGGSGSAYPGGAGGGLIGGSGGGPEAGDGGTQTAGGAAGNGATAGDVGVGGTASPYPSGGGGGGGGWYGGGGSGHIQDGGGGGSGYISPPALSRSFTTGAWSGGDGKVVIYKAG